MLSSCPDDIVGYIFTFLDVYTLHCLWSSNARLRRIVAHSCVSLVSDVSLVSCPAFGHLSKLVLQTHAISTSNLRCIDVTLSNENLFIGLDHEKAVNLLMDIGQCIRGGCAQKLEILSTVFEFVDCPLVEYCQFLTDAAQSGYLADLRKFGIDCTAAAYSDVECTLISCMAVHCPKLSVISNMGIFTSSMITEFLCVECWPSLEVIDAGAIYECLAYHDAAPAIVSQKSMFIFFTGTRFPKVSTLRIHAQSPDIMCSLFELLLEQTANFEDFFGSNISKISIDDNSLRAPPANSTEFDHFYIESLNKYNSKMRVGGASGDDRVASTAGRGTHNAPVIFPNVHSLQCFTYLPSAFFVLLCRYEPVYHSRSAGIHMTFAPTTQDHNFVKFITYSWDPALQPIHSLSLLCVDYTAGDGLRADRWYDELHAGEPSIYNTDEPSVYGGVLSSSQSLGTKLRDALFISRDEERGMVSYKAMDQIFDWCFDQSNLNLIHNRCFGWNSIVEQSNWMMPFVTGDVGKSAYAISPDQSEDVVSKCLIGCMSMGKFSHLCVLYLQHTFIEYLGYGSASYPKCGDSDEGDGAARLYAVFSPCVMLQTLRVEVTAQLLDRHVSCMTTPQDCLKGRTALGYQAHELYKFIFDLRSCVKACADDRAALRLKVLGICYNSNHMKLQRLFHSVFSCYYKSALNLGNDVSGSAVGVEASPLLVTPVHEGQWLEFVLQ